jgi:hypothetical protein
MIIRRIHLPAIAIALAGTCLGMTTAMAHHSFAMFDMQKNTTIEGKVAKFEWTNPHSWLFVAVAGENGAVTNYGFEMASVGELLRRGTAKTTFKAGDSVRIQFHPLQDGTPAGLLTGAWSADGKVLMAPMAAPPSAGGGG